MGTLLKVEFGSDLVGYCDLHPHLELGDLDLDSQLNLLTVQKPTQQAKNSLHWALIDAHARRRGISAFADLKLPTTHWLATDVQQLQTDLAQIRAQSYSHIKIKMGRDLDSETKNLLAVLPELHGLRLRLDFNESEIEKSFSNWWRQNESRLLPSLDYIEDPFVFESQSWSRATAPLALDRNLNRENLKDFSHPTIIFKPAVSEVSWLSSMNKRVVFSSYMDHPLGEMAAIYAAAHYSQTLERMEVCGLRTWHLFEKNEFSEGLQNLGAHLDVAVGTGFGFDDILLNQAWSALS
jgi:O-succinylbenzoate synthase